MIQNKLFLYFLVLIALCFTLAGCGEKMVTSPNNSGSPEAIQEAKTIPNITEAGITKYAVVYDNNCLHSCHQSAVSKGSGANIIDEWKSSRHLLSGFAGCIDCHFLDAADAQPHKDRACVRCHPSTPVATTHTGLPPNAINNPDSYGMCSKCHTKTTGFGETSRFSHYSTGNRASYVSSYNKQHCRNCHNPHDTTFGREQRTAWAESGHGNTRGLARILVDGKSRGTNLPLNQNTGNNNYCVRCHTSTGFINFVADDLFTNVNALRDIGADGLPAPTGFQSNAPEYTVPRTGTNAGKIVNSQNEVFVYNDKSREATNCNVCHIDTRSSGSSSYSGRLRKIANASGVKLYYPYSSVGYKNVTTVQFDTLGNSNLCLTCHSGRATGKTISESGLAASVVALKNPSAPSIHDFAGGAVLQGEKSAFLFYTDPTKYKTSPSHRSINTDGNGPCVSCHMPKVQSTLTGGLIHSHLFRPVSWANDDINQDITEIISNATVCNSCHNGVSQPPITPAFMNQQRKGFRVALLILGRLLPQAFNKPAAGNGGWTGINNNVTPNIAYGTDLVTSLGNMPAAMYTMGANYNYNLLFNEPSSYNHSPILARQLIYDSIDWLIHGTTGFGTSPSDVYTAVKNAPFTTTTTYPATKSGLYWTKVDVIKTQTTGTSSNKDYAIFTDTTADREAALSWLCKGYVSGDTACNRW